MLDFLAFLACKAGYACYMVGLEDAARWLYQRAHAGDPANAEALNWLGYLETVREEYKNALALYRQCLEVEPDSAYVYNQIAYCHYCLGNLNDALAALDQAVRLEPEEIEFFQGRITLLYEADRIDDALEACTDAIHVEPDSAFALLYKGLCYMELRMFPVAAELFEKTVASQPGEPACHLWLGIALLEMARHEEACVHFDEAHRLREDDGIALLWKAVALQAVGQQTNAASLIDELLAGRPGDARVRRMRATLLAGGGELDLALAEVELAIALDPHSPEGHLAKADYLTQRGEQDRALEALRDALELDPAQPDALAGTIRSLMALDRVDEAAKAAAEAVKLIPDSADLRKLAACCHLLAGQPERALDCCPTVESEDADVETLAYRGAALVALGRPGHALKSFEEARRRAPDDPSRVNDLAGALLSAGEPAKAATLLRAAPAPDARSYFLLGCALARTTEVASADSAFDRALELDRADPALCAAVADELSARSIPRALETAKTGLERCGFDVTLAGLTGRLQLESGLPEDALATFERLLAAEPCHALSNYNRACALAMLGRPGDALEGLERAFEYDETLAEGVAADPDLALLREDPRFVRLAARETAAAGFGAPAPAAGPLSTPVHLREADQPAGVPLDGRQGSR